MSRWDYPVDPDLVVKGAAFERDELPAIVDLPPDDPGYQLAVCKFSEELDDELWRRGKRYTVCIRAGRVLVLDDPDASLYNIRKWGHAERKQRRANRHQRAVDAARLDAEQRQRHERSLFYQGQILAAVAAVRAAPAAAAAPRGCPPPGRAVG
jgi:hypothetical protein